MSDNKKEVNSLLRNLKRKQKEQYKTCDLFLPTRDHKKIDITPGSEEEEFLPPVQIWTDNADTDTYPCEHGGPDHLSRTIFVKFGNTTLELYDRNDLLYFTDALNLACSNLLKLDPPCHPHAHECEEKD